mmetsp:Transcript_15019/g.32206  ORF Transcript_15019/g.32206 Transcript_15019/m.32206 type:complete len:214 (-) Transcript_15019:530-1171(-)
MFFRKGTDSIVGAKRSFELTVEAVIDDALVHHLFPGLERDTTFSVFGRRVEMKMNTSRANYLFKFLMIARHFESRHIEIHPHASQEFRCFILQLLLDGINIPQLHIIHLIVVQIRIRFIQYYHRAYTKIVFKEIKMAGAVFQPTVFAVFLGPLDPKVGKLYISGITKGCSLPQKPVAETTTASIDVHLLVNSLLVFLLVFGYRGNSQCFVILY